MGVLNEISRIVEARNKIRTKLVSIGLVNNTANLTTCAEALYAAGDEIEPNQVTFYDYDGTILYKYTRQEFMAPSALPENPSHAELVCQGWNWTLTDAKAYLTTYTEAGLNIGQTYTTASGKTEIDIVLKAPYLSPYLKIAINGTVDIDWGDGSGHDIVTGTSSNTRKFTLHNYSSAGNYTISISVTSGSFAFSCNTYGGGVLSDEQRDSRSTQYSTYITAIRLGNGATIGSDGFANCYNLKSITIPNTVTSGADSAFSGCFRLQSITIPTSFTQIAVRLFQNCSSLTSVCLPNTITSFGDYAFDACTSLKRISIPSVASSLSAYLFRDCEALKNIVIPNSVTSIGIGSFYSCGNLEKITIPNSVTSMGVSTFYECSNLNSIILSSGLTTIPERAFSTTRCLKNVVIPNGVLIIENDAFRWNDSIESLTISNTVTSIGTQAFASINSLGELTIPGNVKTIGNNAFDGCKNLVHLTISNGVETLGTSVFANCFSLVKVTIPSSVTSMGNTLFNYNYSMQEVHMLSTTPPTLGTGAFYTMSGFKIYVPYSSNHSVLNAYKAATNWSTYASYIFEET